jgi:hypothetical protein
VSSSPGVAASGAGVNSRAAPLMQYRRPPNPIIIIIIIIISIIIIIIIVTYNYNYDSILPACYRNYNYNNKYNNKNI